MRAPGVVMHFGPLTKEFRARIQGTVGPNAVYYDASDLRKMSLFAGLRDLRRVEAERTFIAIESAAARPLIGPLSLAAAFIRARSIQVIWPDLRVEALSRVKAIGSVFRLLSETVRGRRALARYKTRMAELEQTSSPRALPPARGHRILYLDTNISLGAPIGGSFGHTAGVIGGFIDHGFSVDYASIKPVPTNRPGVHWLKLEPRTLLAAPAELNYYPYSELIERKIAVIHHAAPWSFIYQRFSLHNCLGPLLGRRLNVPVVVEFNGSEAWAAEHWGARLALHEEAMTAERTVLGAADLIVTVSDPLGEDVRRRGVPEQRILVYPNCVDPHDFDPQRFEQTELQAVRAKYGIPQDAFLVGFIGTFGQWHGVDFLAECIRTLVDEDREWLDRHRVRFMLVGDGVNMPTVRQVVERQPVWPYVTLTGLVQQAEAPRYLACANLLVSPHIPNPDGSEFFGSPTKLFEYMAMERPILASALGQIADVIGGRGATKLGPLPGGAGRPCGVTFEPGNQEAFKHKLRRLVEDRSLAAEYARAARAEVLARYTWKRHVRAITERMAELNLLERVRDRAKSLRD